MSLRGKHLNAITRVGKRFRKKHLRPPAATKVCLFDGYDSLECANEKHDEEAEEETEVDESQHAPW